MNSMLEIDQRNAWKQETRKQWNTMPCGEVEHQAENLDYFLKVEEYRYKNYAPWMKECFDFSAYANKKVLEIGYGQGTDLCQFAKAGADCAGVDITEKHYELATKNLQTRGLKANLYLEDASKLHFDDESFDLVYSFGVLHHTPDTIRCFSEAFRVLKPGGEFVVSLYHRHSAFYYVNMLLIHGLLKGKLRRLGHAGLLSTIENGADGVTIKPLVKLYTAKELRIMLSDFRKVEISVKHLYPYHFSLLGRFIPPPALRWLEPQIGWYVIAKAIK